MRDAAHTGDELLHELDRLKAPPLSEPLTPDAFPLCLAKTADQPFDSADWLFEIKYDGVRALAIRDGGKTQLFGRNRREITQRYPEAALALDALPLRRFALDGEIVVPDESGRPSFQLLQRRINVADPREVARLSLALPVTYWVFDLLAAGDYDLRTWPLEARKELLARLVRGEGPVRFCDHVVARGRDFFAAADQASLEGIIAKRRRAAYRGIRSDDWIKIKCPRIDRFVIAGWTLPAGSRRYFGALLIGQYEPGGTLRFVSRVGTGFDEDLLHDLHDKMKSRERAVSPLSAPVPGQAAPPRGSRFCEPELVCDVRFGEWTDDGGIRHPSFIRLVPDADARACVYHGPGSDEISVGADSADGAADALPALPAGENGDNVTRKKDFSARSSKRETANGTDHAAERVFTPTHTDKIFWPDEGYTKGDLIHYYETIAPWMLPYLKDRPVVLTRYPDGFAGKSFFQKDAPAFAPEWIRTEKIYSEDSHREISYFVLETPEALAYMANLGAIPIHIWSSRFPHLERPDWLLFDIDPKNSTTKTAVIVAREVGDVLREIGMRPYVKTSGQKGIHVVVGLVPSYTYEQAKMFSELVARVVVARIPDAATLVRDVNARHGRVYIDYLQLGHGKTIAAPFAVRPVRGAPVSAPLEWKELRPALDPAVWNIKTMIPRMRRLKHDPFLGALTDQQRLETSLPRLEALAARSAAAR
jgi:bifunctional non-homologous end joining protein LigD